MVWVREEDRKFLLELAQALKLAEPIGNVEDMPEGSGVIEWSLTLARMVSLKLEDIANNTPELIGGNMLVTKSFRVSK